MSHQKHLKMTTLLLLFLAPLAQAQDEAPIEAIVGSRAEVDPAGANGLNVTLDELERDYPAVARAVRQPDFIQRVAAAEQASTRAFLDRVSATGLFAFRVGEEYFSVGITQAQLGLPSANDMQNLGSNEAPGLAGSLGIALLATAALVGKVARKD